ncbi:MAG: hypothetical protein AB3N23_05495 [Paracoccaceae bacterium]
MKRLISVTAATLILSASGALAGYTNAFDITLRGNGFFDVKSNVGPDTSIFWCGAGQSVRSSSQRIYIWQGRSGQGRDSFVRFGLTPPASGAVVAASISVDLVGNSLTAAQARQYCLDKTIPDN